jgi:hypothetical protein
MKQLALQWINLSKLTDQVNFYKNKIINVLIFDNLTALDKRVIHYIACTNTSFRSINHPTFHSLFWTNNSMQKLKDEKHFREWAFPRVYLAVKNCIQAQLDQAEYLNFTSDIWSSKTTKHSFIRFN